MKLHLIVLASCVSGLVVQPSTAAEDGTVPSKASATGIAPVALRVVSKTPAKLSADGIVGWIPPTPCDSDGNVYFLMNPHATLAQVKAAAKANRDLPLDPREVLRVSADGKKTISFDPSRDPKLANAKRLTTSSIAVDGQGWLYLLVWGESEGAGGLSTGAQYILSFNEKGDFRSETRIDGQEIQVLQFEVFGSGQFLLRGRGTHSSRPRLAILTGEAGLQDVVGWHSSLPDAADDQGSPRAISHMVRGSDGRIYLAEWDAERGKSVVYALTAAGQIEEVLELRPLKGNPQLMGLLASGNKLAAQYLETQPGSQSNQRWWTAIYDVGSGGDTYSIYGPVSSVSFCYTRTESEDRFITLVDGDKLVTLSP